MRVTATAKYLRGSTRKARLVTQAIKGKPVEEAAALLRFMPQRAAEDVARVLKSATANAENNHNLSAEDLVIVDAIANPNGVGMLHRDCVNIAEWFTRKRVEVDAEALFGELLAELY